MASNTACKWKARKPRSLRFVDDGSLWAKINLHSARIVQRVGRKPLHEKSDIQTENAFNQILLRAGEKGIKVNVAKTQMPVNLTPFPTSRKHM